MILVVDDLRLFGDIFNGMPVIYALNSEQALDILKYHAWSANPFIEVFCDHDLGEVNGKYDDITPVINWLEEAYYFENPKEVRNIKLRILTSNSVGYQRIKVLEKYFEILPTPQHIGIRE